MVFSIIVLFLPGLMVLINRTQSENASDSWVVAPEYTELYGNILRFFNSTSSFILIVLGTVILFFVFKKHKEWQASDFTKNKPLQFYMVVFLVPYLVMFFFSKLVQPVFLDRYLLFTSLPLYLLFGQIVYVVLKEVKLVFILILIVPLIASVRFAPNTNRNPEKIVEFVKAHEPEPVMKYVCPVWIDLTFLYHYDSSIFKSYTKVINHEISNFKAIYGVEDIDLTTDFILVVSTEGWVKEKAQVLNFFESSHHLNGYELINNLYHLFKFEVNGK